MSMIDTHKNNIARKRNEAAKLSQDKAIESKKISAQQQKIQSAKRTLSSTKSQSTIKTKLNDIAQAESEIAKANKKVAQKEKDITAEEKTLRTEENREQKKVQLEEKKRLEHSKKEMRSMTATLSQHGRTQQDLQRAIIDLQNIPEKIKVLFMASNPVGSVPLRLDEEARAIQEMITKAKHRDSVEFVTRWAARSSDILQAINQINPDVIHFSGHGTDMDELVLQNTDGSPKLITKRSHRGNYRNGFRQGAVSIF